MKTGYSNEPSYTGTSPNASPSYSREKQEEIKKEWIRTDKRNRLKKRIAFISVCAIIVLSLATYLFMTKVYLPRSRRKADFRKLVSQDVKVGDIVIFGEYEWDNTWYVNDIQGSKIQLLNIGYSDGFDYNAPRAIEYWLSNDYYEVAFDEKDKALIAGKWNNRITYDNSTAQSYVIGIVKRTVYPQLWIDTALAE